MASTATAPAVAPPSGKTYRTELSPVSFLRRSAYVYPEKVAVVHGERRLTYSQFEERVNRLASALVAAGIRPGDRVAFLAPNIPALLEAHYAVPASGAALVAINTRLVRDEVAYILEHSGAKLLFVDHELEPLVAGTSVPTIRIDDTGAVDDPYEAFLAGGSPGLFERALSDEEATISINYTSGTTGRPKGVMYTHRGAYLNALAELAHARLDCRSVYLWTLPMFHCNGWCFTWAVTAAGARHVCLAKVDPPLIWRLFEEEGITHLNGEPTVLVMLGSDPAAKPLPHPILVTTAGAPPPPAVIERTEALGFEINHLYGLTETYGPITICEWHSDWDELDVVERARLKARQGLNMLTADRIR